MTKQTKIVNISERRSKDELMASLSSLKKKILDLKVGEYRYSHITPHSIPGIDVIVTSDKVLIKYLCDRRTLDNISSLIGNRLLEYMESSLYDTYDHLSKIKQDAEEKTNAVLRKVSTTAKMVMQNGKSPIEEIEEGMAKMQETKETNEYPKYKIKPSEEVEIYSGDGKEGGEMCRMHMRVVNKDKDAKFMTINLYMKNKDDKWMIVDAVNLTVNPEHKGILQMIVPRAIRMSAFCKEKGIRMRILQITTE